MMALFSGKSMSKYNDLCEIYRESRNKYFDFEMECVEFAERLVDQLVTYFSVPEGRSKLFPTLGEANPALIYSVQEAMRMGPDTFWNLGIGIELQCNDCPDTPDQPVLINLALRKDGGVFIVKISDKDPGHRVNGDLSNASDFFDHLFNTVRDLLQANINRYLAKKPVDCQIGFHSNCE